MNLLSKIVFFLLLLITGCHEKNTVSFIPILSATPFNLAFTYKGGESVITIASNTNWNINSLYSWCRPSLETGNGNTSITIITDRNELKEKRQPTFYITARDAKDITRSINQDAFDPAIAYSITSGNTYMRALTSLELSKFIGISVEYRAIHRASLSSGQEEHIQLNLDNLRYITNSTIENDMLPFYWNKRDTGNNESSLINKIDGGTQLPVEFKL